MVGAACGTEIGSVRETEPEGKRLPITLGRAARVRGAEPGSEACGGTEPGGGDDHVSACGAGTGSV